MGNTVTQKRTQISRLKYGDSWDSWLTFSIPFLLWAEINHIGLLSVQDISNWISDLTMETKSGKNRKSLLSRVFPLCPHMPRCGMPWILLINISWIHQFLSIPFDVSALKMCSVLPLWPLRCTEAYALFPRLSPGIPHSVYSFPVSPPMLTCSIPGPLKHHPVRSMSTQPTCWALASIFPPSLSLDLKVSEGSPRLNRLLIYILWRHFLHSHKEFLPAHLFPQDALRMLTYFQKVSHFYWIKYIPWAQHLRLSKVSLCLWIFFFPTHSRLYWSPLLRNFLAFISVSFALEPNYMLPRTVS